MLEYLVFEDGKLIAICTEERFAEMIFNDRVDNAEKPNVKLMKVLKEYRHA